MKLAGAYALTAGICLLLLSGVCEAQRGHEDREKREERSGREERPAERERAPSMPVPAGMGSPRRANEAVPSFNAGNMWQGRDVMKSRRVSVPEPRRFESPAHVVNDNRQFTAPRVFGGGEVIRQRSESEPPRQHNTIMRNAGVLRDIDDQRRSETLRDHFYWHESGGVSFAHYFDDRGIHWYGFYHGPRFYWCRFYLGDWWWFDPVFARWTFWWDGYWWWMGPGGAYYVYVSNNYYPYDSGGVTVSSTETMPSPVSKPSLSGGTSWTSPDGHRLVQVQGDRAEAFLYDNTGSTPVFLTYLGRGVDKVRFSGGKTGGPLQILLDFKDGSFALYDADGKALEPAAVVPPAPKETPGGEATPPLPTTAPGEAPPGGAVP